MKIKHLQQIHDLGTYRNACRVIKNQLTPYVHEARHEREKIFYLNKEGREFIGSTNEVTKTQNTPHTLLRNEVYLHHKCPVNWKNECILEHAEAPTQRKADVIIGKGSMKLKESKRVVCDAIFSRNGYTYIIEVDNTRKMIDNKRKVESYAEILPYIRGKLEGSPVVCFYTTTEDRKKKLSALLKSKSIHHEVKTFGEIR